MTNSVFKAAYLFLIIFLGIASFAISPGVLHAATSCPTGPGWSQRTGFPLLPQETACLLNGNPMGTASTDHTPISCPAGSTSLFTGGVGGTSSAGQSCVSTTNGTPVTSNDNTKLASCSRASIFSGAWSDWGSCFMATASVSIGVAIFQVLSTILGIAEMLLKFVIEKTVLTDGFATIYSALKEPAEAMWTFIRDLVNIGIIGIFVFVAISLILGLKEYGQKKLIASVLIIAILINFSFLFTRIIINASNVFTTNIYNQMISPLLTGGAAGAPASSIGDKYLNDLRVKSLMQAGDTLTARYNGSNESLGPLWMHILVSSLVMLGVTLAFIFAAIMLLSRFIVLIGALFLSAAAFASFIHPSTRWLWDMWWSALLQNAVLAPIFFIFLWVSLQTSDRIAKVVGATGNWGAVSVGYTSNAEAGTVALLVNYLLVLGFLFLGIYLSKSLSHSLANRIAISAAAIPLTWGSKYVAAPLARNTLGRFGIYRSEANNKEAKQLTAKAAAAIRRRDQNLKDSPAWKAAQAEADRFTKAATTALTRAGKYDNLAKNKFNIMDSSAAQTLSKALKLSGLTNGASSKDTKSAADAEKVRKEAASKVAEKAQPSKQDLAAARKDAEDARQLIKDGLKGAKDEAEATTKALKDFSRATRQHEDSAKYALRAETEEAAARGTGNHAEKVRIATAARAAVERSRAEVETLTQNNPGLQRLTGLPHDHPEVIQSINDAERAEKQAAQALKTHEEATKAIANHAAHALEEAGELVAKAVGRRSGSVWERAVGTITGDNERMAKAVVKEVHKHHSEASIRDALKGFIGDGHGGETGGAGNTGGEVHHT